MRTVTLAEKERIYRKSIHLLTHSQQQLDELREVLRKTVSKLTEAAYGHDRELDNLLDQIRDTIDADIDTEALDLHLDHLQRTTETREHPATEPDVLNQRISELLLEKRELELFIQSITRQLAEIERYVQGTRASEESSAASSLQLKDAVDACVDRINDSVESSDNLDELKNRLEVHLDEIRRNVAEHNRVEQEKEDISRADYEQLMEELGHVKAETSLLREQLEESQSQLLRDTLTGLPNRLAYDERISVEFERWKRSGSPLCIAVWDIDHFKHFNDTYGHEIGDRVLKIFSEVISNRIRKVDTFARIGGEEFALIMPDTPEEIALTLNDELRHLLESCDFKYQGEKCMITASVGISTFLGGAGPDDVIRNADIALYHSKANGRNRCTIYEEGMEMPGSS